MSATAAPYGAEPQSALDGGVGLRLRPYAIASGYNTSIFQNDFVLKVAGGGIEKDTGTATATPIGIFHHCTYTDSSGTPKWSNYWPASTVAADAVAYVQDDPDIEFTMQANGSVAAADEGANAAIIQTAGSTITGRSKNALSASSINTTNTLPLRIIKIVNKPGNTAGDAYTEVLCRINTAHQMRAVLGV